MYAFGFVKSCTFKSLISKCFVFEQLITLSLARSVCTLFRLLFYAFIPIRFLSFVFIYIKNILLYSCVSVIVAVAVSLCFVAYAFVFWLSVIADPCVLSAIL